LRHEGTEVELHSFVTSSPVGEEWLAARDLFFSANVPLGMH